MSKARKTSHKWLETSETSETREFPEFLILCTLLLPHEKLSTERIISEVNAKNDAIFVVDRIINHVLMNA